MTALLEARDISYSHPGGFGLEGVSLRLGAGERVALVGPNGAGKSTLLKLLAGVLAADGGEIRVGGTLPPGRSHSVVAWVPQEMDAPPFMTVEELAQLGFFPRARFGGWAPPDNAREKLETVLRRLGLTALRRRRVGSLSGGERRRALLARALTQEARVLLLDEPTAHLDPGRQAELSDILEGLRGDGVAVVMALHDVNWAWETCKRVILMSAGRLAADGPATEVLTPEALARAYGAHARVIPGLDGGSGRIRFFTQPEEETQ